MISSAVISRVLIPIEDDLFAEAIEDILSKMVWSDFTIFRVVHVIEPQDKRMAWPIQEYRKEAEALVSRLANKLREDFKGVLVEEVILEGYAADTIIDDAIIWEADLIVTGAHGRRGVRRFLLGSVANALAASAPCTVLVVRPEFVVAEREAAQEMVSPSATTA